MLIEFRFRNYRSYRDETVLSMETAGLGSFKNCLIVYKNTKLIPAAAIYGKNGGGKSNVIRAFWLAVQFVKNAQRTQNEDAEVPVKPFLLNDYSASQPTEFQFIYILDGIKYWYSFSATREKIVSEYLYHAPKGQKAKVFSRTGQSFDFTEDKARRKLISETVAQNQLFFSIACTMNDESCIRAMKWFRERIFFSRDYSDIPRQLIKHYEDKKMLKAIADYAKSADFGIDDIKFEIDNREVDGSGDVPDGIPDEVKTALAHFLAALSQTSNNEELHLRMQKITATTKHLGRTMEGDSQIYSLDLSDESDGTRRLMSLAPAIESVLSNGGILLADEIDRGLHPVLVKYVLAKFQSKRTNPKGAQIIFTTHDIELLNLELLRKDQLYFVDKTQSDGASELYSISELGTRTADNIIKGYLIGKYGGIPNVAIEEVE